MAADPGAPAVSPTGPTARVFTIECRNDVKGTLTVDIPDLDRLADVLNAGGICEYDGGVARAHFTVMCRSSSLVVSLTSKDGRIQQPSREALCL